MANPSIAGKLPPIPDGAGFQSGALFSSLTVGENVGLYLSEHRLKPPRKSPASLLKTRKRRPQARGKNAQ